MQVRRQLASLLVLLTALAMPQALGLAAHALAHHEHAEHAEEAPGHAAEWTGLAQALVHGHEHEEGMPDHEHHLLPSPPWRQEAPRDLQAPALPSAAASESVDLPVANALPRRHRIEPPGSSPPRLHRLCVLLI